MQTLAEYKQAGGVVAFVPNDVTHIQTRPKARVIARNADGIETIYRGPEVLMTEVVMDDGKPVRVVRFSSLVDFDHIKAGNLEWERLNPELCLRVCQTLRKNNSNQPGPIGF